MYKLPIVLVFFCVCPLFSQIGPRGWQDHISINSSNSVTRAGSTVYASYRAGIVSFDQKELSPRPVNKINGLSDVGVTLLRNNPYNNKTLVVYENCNIDIIEPDQTIKNYPDFKMKALNGKKIVNEVTFVKQLAYLACGFGIVVFDTEKMEVKETYIIGPNASDVDVLQVALNDSLIFAATDKGVYWSNHKTRVLNNFQNWKIDTRLPPGFYPGIVNAGGYLLTACAPSRTNTASRDKDSLYILNANAWQKYGPTSGTGMNIIKMGPVYGDMFSVFDLTSFIVMDVTSGTKINYLSSFNGEVDYGQMRDAYFAKDHTGQISYWIADNRFGLYQTYGYHPYVPQNKLTRNGTNRSFVGNIDVNEGRVALAPSLIRNDGGGNFIIEGVNILEKGEWRYQPVTDPAGTPLMDITSVLFDRKDKTKMWVASWSYGIAAYKDNKQLALFNKYNTGMPATLADTIPRCGGLSMDNAGNVWFAHSDQKGFLGVIKTNGQYQNLQFDNGRFTRKTFIDRNGFIWILHEREGGITVFRPAQKNNVFDPPVLNVNYRVLNNAPGSGNLESNAVYSIAEDHDGRLWIGTSAGIRVLYNPAAVFSSNEIDAQPIKIVQDGNVELLLGKETVTSIIVDGANNKWCGTAQGGVYCFSPDGLKQIYHFTKENSPLYSNEIVDLNYDKTTGDVFFGTVLGLQSFRSIVIEGGEQYADVHAYPNPVRPNYQGTVLVRGLMDNSIVKIADESGNLVWEAKSAGGQIEWPVKTLAGARVTTGVYIVYASTTDGEFKALTKVLVVN